MQSEALFTFNHTRIETYKVSTPQAAISFGSMFMFEQHTQIAKFMEPTWGPSGSCRTQMGPMLAPWTLLSG